MNRRLFLQSLAATALPASSANADTKKRVVLFGDSEVGLLATEFKRLARAEGYEPATVGVPGSSVRSWLMGLDAEWSKIAGFKPDVLLICLGANDCCLPRYTLENHEADWLKRFRSKLTNLPGTPVWWSPPKIGNQQVLSQALWGLPFFVNLLHSFPIPVVDARAVEVSMWSDRLHPDDQGRITWAQYAWAQTLIQLKP